MCKYVKWQDKTIFEVDVDDVYLKELAAKIDGFSGADISALYAETAMSAIRRNLQMDDSGKAFMTKDAENILISKDDFEAARLVIKSTEQRTLESNK